MTTTTLATIQPHQHVETIAACTHKRRLPRRSGQPYLAVVLRDSSASVEGRIWKSVDRFERRFDDGDVVRVTGRVRPYHDALQLHIDDIERAPHDEVDPAALMPYTHRDIDELDGFLEHLAGEVHDPQLAALLAALLDDLEVRSSWRHCPATLVDHHAFLGGLLEHTVAVATLAEQAAQLHPQLDSDLLLCAAIVHDLGRIRELTFERRFGLTEQGRLLGHVALGQQLILQRGLGLVDPHRLACLAHCIARHHDPPGQLRGFEIPEALVLARLNALDADTKGAYERKLSIVGPAV
ncbi:MAG: OB-fold nucleic acid binding domain-containing protein [Solirubrobacteraceae bacterium]